MEENSWLPRDIIERITEHLEFRDVVNVCHAFDSCIDPLQKSIQPCTPRQVHARLGNTRETCEFLEWVSPRYSMIEHMRLGIVPRIWNDTAPSYLEGSALRRVTLYPYSHSDIACTDLWMPHAEHIDSEFFVPSPTCTMHVHSKDDTVYVISSDPMNTLQLTRSESLETLDVEGPMDLTEIPLDIPNIRIHNATLSVDSFMHVMKTSHLLELDNVCVPDLKDPIPCHAHAAVLTSNVLRYIQSFPKTSYAVDLLVDSITGLDIQRVYDVPYVTVTGPVPGEHYRNIHYILYTMFPNARFHMDLDLVLPYYG